MFVVVSGFELNWNRLKQRRKFFSSDYFQWVCLSLETITVALGAVCFVFFYEVLCWQHMKFTEMMLIGWKSSLFETLSVWMATKQLKLQLYEALNYSTLDPVFFSQSVNSYFVQIFQLLIDVRQAFHWWKKNREKKSSRNRAEIQHSEGKNAISHEFSKALVLQIASLRIKWWLLSRVTIETENWEHITSSV